MCPMPPASESQEGSALITPSSLGSGEGGPQEPKGGGRWGEGSDQGRKNSFLLLAAPPYHGSSPPGKTRLGAASVVGGDSLKDAGKGGLEPTPTHSGTRLQHLLAGWLSNNHWYVVKYLTYS